MSEYNYVVTVILVTSLALNANMLLCMVIRMLWRLAHSCSRTVALGTYPVKDLVFILTDEVINTVLLVNAVYCCLTLDWPADYLTPPLPHNTPQSDTPHSTPATTSASDANISVSIVTLICCNLARYIFRILFLLDKISSHDAGEKQLIEDKANNKYGIISKVARNRGSPAHLLVHHLMVAVFLVLVLIYRDLWWYAVVAIFMEMNNIIMSMRKFMKAIHREYWEVVAVKFGVIELVSIVSFRMVLPMVLILIYITNNQVNESLTAMDVAPRLTLIIVLIFFSLYQVCFFGSYLQSLMYLRRNPQPIHRIINACKIPPTVSKPSNVITDNKGSILKKGIPGRVSFNTPVVLNDFQVVSEGRKQHQQLGVTLHTNNTINKQQQVHTTNSHNLTLLTKVNDIKGQTPVAPPPSVLLKQTSNVNTDQSPSGKNCDKALLRGLATPSMGLNCNQS